MIPNYIKALAKFISAYRPDGPWTVETLDTYRLVGKYPYGQNKTLIADAERIVAWAKRCHADAYIVDAQVGRTRNQRKRGIGRDYVLIYITDPAAFILEKHSPCFKVTA